ncbi:LTA synthase family protein [Phascolarctobacterium sp.]
MEKFSLFFKNLQQEMKLFLFFTVLFMLFRIAFIGIYSYQLGDGSYSEIVLCLWYGLRLSFKTTGMIVLISAVFATLPQLFFIKWPSDLLRKVISSSVVLLFTLLFFARIPYYKIFNSGFNIMLINGMYDDISAIVDTAVNEYQLLWCLPAAIICGIILAWILCKFLDTRTYVIKVASKTRRWLYSLGIIIFLTIFWIFVRFGGAFSYTKSVNCENAERLKSNLLNEAILDDGQALYRVKSITERIKKINNVNISANVLRQKIELLGGNPSADSIDDAFKKVVTIPKLQEQPDNVVLIVGESHALWPFLPEYENLGLVPKELKLLNSPNCFKTDFMLAQGTGTMPTINGFVMGLADAGIYPNSQPESYKTKYGTGIGSIMKALGYRTVFWYGGFEAWQDIKRFTLSQNFDEFYCAGDFQYEGGNSWGCPDEVLFKYVEKYLNKEKQEKTFHIILTTSNHPPYNIDVVAKGFPKEEIKQKLPDTIGSDEETLNEIGHIWYADQSIGDFIENVEADKPDTLFVITGDHAERFNFAKEVDLKTLSAVPCIFYGKNVSKDLLAEHKVGCHLQIIPTLAEMVGKKGDTYSSIYSSLFDYNGTVFNHYLWTNDEQIYKINKKIPEALSNKIKAARQLTAWRVLKGDKIQ